MFRHIFGDEQKTPVDDEIDAVLDRMSIIGVKSEDYPQMIAYLERLYALKTSNRREPVSRDTVALVAGNLLGILMIVAYEQKHVMTSKGLSQLIRLRTSRVDS